MTYPNVAPGQTKQTYDDPVSVVAFGSTLGNYAAGYSSIRVGWWNREVLVGSFDLSSGSDKVRPTERVRGLAFGPDDSFLCVAASDKLFALRSDGTEAWSYEPPRSFGFLVISPIAVAAHQERVVAAFDNGSMAVFDESGKLLKLWKDNETPRKLTITDSGLILGSDSFSLCGWSVETGARAFSHILSHRVFAFSAARSKDLVALRTLREVMIVEPRKNEVVTRISVDPSAPVVAISPDGERVALTVHGGFRVAATATGETLQEVSSDVPVTAMDFFQAPGQLLLGYANGEVRVHSTP